MAKRKRTSKYKSKSAKRRRKTVKAKPVRASRGRFAFNRKPKKAPNQTKASLTKLMQKSAPFFARRTDNDGSSIPLFKQCQLAYSQSFSMGNGTLPIFYHTFRLNSVYDPDHTGVGGQPNGFDTWNTIYNRYAVIGASYTVRFSHRLPANTDTLIGVVTVNPTATDLQIDNLVDARERPSVKTVTIQPTSHGNNNNTAVITGRIRVSDWLLPTSGSFGEQMCVSTSTNPSNVVALHVGIMDLEGGTPDLAVVWAEVRITYDVIFMEPTVDTSDGI